MPSTRERVRASWIDLPAAARQVLFADLVSTAGSGIVLPFLAIYVGRVRDLGPSVGAAAVAAIAVGCLPANLIAGAAADRYGARHVLVTGWVVAAAGDLCLLGSAHWATLLAAAVLIGLGVGTAYPATSTLLAEVTPPEQRSLVFATQYGLSNVGLSLGIGVSAVIVAVPELNRFQALYAVDAVTFLVAGAVLLRADLPRLAPGDLDPEPPPEPLADLSRDHARLGAGWGAGYRRVAADAAFRWLCLVQILLVVFGYAQFHAALPIYLSRPHGLDPSMIALVFIANTGFVALVALPAGRLGHRFSRPRLIAAGAACFAACWLLLWLARGSGWPSVSLAIASAIVMGLGEVLLAPSVGPLVNQLSPADLRGRYNAVNALILSVGSILGPGLVAILYTGSTATPLFAVLIGGCLAAALLATRPPYPVR
jgi:MFS family permease